MEINFPLLPFERYADDMIVHCKNPKQANHVLSRIKERLEDCKLRIHPEKTKICYCPDSNRYRRSHPIIRFTFLGYSFMPRRCKTKNGHVFTSFTPAISSEAVKEINNSIKKMVIHRMTEAKLEVIASMLNPKIRGWINYYGKFRKSELQKVFYGLNNRLFKWARWKYKQYRTSIMGAIKWMRRIVLDKPKLFVHWEHGFVP